MKKMLFGIIVVGLLASCAKPVHIKVEVDEAIVNDLPKEVALKFLREVSTTPENRYPERSCLIENEGVRVGSEQIGMRQTQSEYAPWQELKLRTWDSNERECVVTVEFPASERTFWENFTTLRLGYCFIVNIDAKKAYLKSEGTAPDYQKLCRQSVTALKSLGIKVKSK